MLKTVKYKTWLYFVYIR